MSTNEERRPTPGLRLVESTAPRRRRQDAVTAADERDLTADLRDVEAAQRDLRQAIETELNGGDEDRRHRANRHASMLDRAAAARDRQASAADRRRG